MILSDDTRRALARGRALYNAAEFWEAHEAWEDAWQVEDGEVRQLLQGLIQVAAGFYKARVQLQPRGCVKLLTAGLEKLAPLPDDSGGLALGRFRASVERALAEGRRWEQGERGPLEAALVPPLDER